MKKKTSLDVFNEKLLELVSDSVFFSSGYYDFMKHENDKKRFNFRFRQYMRILEREMSVRSENEAINNINHLMEKDKVIENVLGQFIVGNSIKIYSNKKIEAKEPSANNFDDYSFENNNNLRSYSKKEAVNASFVLS